MEIENLFLEEIDSTNIYAKKHVNEFDKNKITVIIAEEQTSGKGRFQRNWLSPKGENIYATFYFKLKKDCFHLTCLAQLMTLSIAKVLIKEGLKPKIRWPNDIIIDDEKLAGVLCEITTDANGCDIFLGVGINVDTDLKILKKIDKPATSLKEKSKRIWNKNELLSLLQNQFNEDLEIFMKDGFTPFHAQYENLMAYISQEIECECGDKKYSGICHSLSCDGQLNLYLPSKEIMTLSAADVTLKTIKQRSH
jgi:BirA family transcriptional regulator, biotin operon repressor / biotin---[acetyl-CoA-carboxylase] ligase